MLHIDWLFFFSFGSSEINFFFFIAKSSEKKISNFQILNYRVVVVVAVENIVSLTTFDWYFGLLPISSMTMTTKFFGIEFWGINFQ